VSFHRAALTSAAAVAVFASLSVVNPMAASAKVSIFEAILDGPSEDPPVNSPGTGTAFLTTDDVLNTLRLQVSFGDLIGGTTVAHIHAPTAVANGGVAGVATTVPTFPFFPTGVTSGTYDQTFDMLLASSYNPTFINNNGGSPATAQAALFSAIFEGKAYLNIHTTEFGGGEIRGFFQPQPESVPGPLPLLGVGAAFGWSRRLRNRQRQKAKAD
jgi:MYXO-CTERM domain-containing protein